MIHGKESRPTAPLGFDSCNAMCLLSCDGPTSEVQLNDLKQMACHASAGVAQQSKEVLRITAATHRLPVALRPGAASSQAEGAACSTSHVHLICRHPCNVGSFSCREHRMKVETLGNEICNWLQGPSAREARRDTTAFEAARAEWGKAELSIKGGVGAEGDHRTELWLG